MSENAPPPLVLDKKTIAQIRAVSQDYHPGFLDELIALYLSQTPKLIAEMRGFAKEGDGANLEFTAHRLKGSSLNLGALQMAELCGEIERKARAPGALEPLIGRFAKTFPAAKKALKELKHERET